MTALLARLLSFSLALTPLAQADDHVTHALAMHGQPKYGADFSHFDYVNPDAPQGGTLRQASIGTFDSLNPFIGKGVSAAGSGLLYDTLAVHAYDEPFTMYGLVAKDIILANDRSWIEFRIHPDARFQDGHPISAEDVAYTFKLLTEQGNPFYQAYYHDVGQVEVLDSQRIRFQLTNPENLELPLILTQLPVLPKHYWQDRDFQTTSLEPPLGSGPYKVEKVDAGRSISYVKVADYWAKNHPAVKGHYNFERMQYDYYRDEDVAVEAFKAGEFDLRIESSAKRWATGYQSPALEQGKIKLLTLEDHSPAGMQGFVYNIRRSQFSDPRVRQALAYAFDFEWSNTNLFYSSYQRTNSYFANSELAATGLPSQAELALLEPLREQVPAEVFSQVYQAPTSDGSGNIRNNLRQALSLLKEAGWTMEQGKLVNQASKAPFQFEILLYSPAMERVATPFVRNLERLGIQVSLRMVDVTQYVNRLRSFDFDMVVATFPQSNSPGNEQREFWHSSKADQADSRNLIGIKNPAVDTLIEHIINAKDREALVAACRALDRVLLWNHYVIPQFNAGIFRIATWDKFGHPDPLPEYAPSPLLETWWQQP
ncbi:extracellular solute-binding protein [Balneatrix alpica]|uniref:extracellular solute-binding protein n=1 Tax=Balneatrix alpica TaxID=75684 RepID=UPI0027396F0D|nr:extracellular solute-binding protein [Balneatrix alpica]